MNANAHSFVGREMMRSLVALVPLLVACSADTNAPTVTDGGATDGVADTRATTDTGSGSTCKDKCSATEKCWPASCTGGSCGTASVSVPAESRCIDGCCETLEQSCDRVCP